MSRKSRTVATFAVRFDIPNGHSIQQARQFIWDALCTFKNSPDHTFDNIKDENFTVTLIHKDTSYASY